MSNWPRYFWIVVCLLNTAWIASRPEAAQWVVALVSLLSGMGIGSHGAALFLLRRGENK